MKDETDKIAAVARVQSISIRVASSPFPPFALLLRFSTPTVQSRHVPKSASEHRESNSESSKARQLRSIPPAQTLATETLSSTPTTLNNNKTGSHTVLALLDAGFSVTVFDNLDNSFLECFERMKELAGAEKAAKMTFVKGDLRDAAAVDAALGSEKFDAVIHFAGRKAVGESVAEPMLYYTHNVAGTVNLIEAMRKHGVRNVSFFPFSLHSSPSLL